MSQIVDLLRSALPAPMKAAFGDEAVLVHDSGSAAIAAMFREPLPDEEYPAAVRIAEIFRSDIAVTPRQGEFITSGSETYRIIDVKSDEVVWKLVLQR